jgi:hypothetical protein
MDIQQTKLNDAQITFLQLFNRPLSDKDLSELQRLVTRYFADKALNIADRVWEEKGYTEEQLLNIHERTAYAKKQH